MCTSLVEKKYPDLNSSFNKGRLPASDPQKFKLLNSETHGRSLLKIIINFESNLSKLSFAFNLPQPKG